mmetsp:Transcript_74312/g.214782  ORF Transcript_74312/g.214782 Transcript_74312/m.214782 type:complete len:220 (+) Transcript_74312:859-1518(+)
MAGCSLASATRRATASTISWEPTSMARPRSKRCSRGRTRLLIGKPSAWRWSPCRRRSLLAFTRKRPSAQRARSSARGLPSPWPKSCRRPRSGSMASTTSLRVSRSPSSPPRPSATFRSWWPSARCRCPRCPRANPRGSSPPFGSVCRGTSSRWTRTPSASRPTAGTCSSATSPLCPRTPSPTPTCPSASRRPRWPSCALTPRRTECRFWAGPWSSLAAG